MALILFLVCRCIDPYDPQLSNYESLLVVDALVTDANSSYKVSLSRTFQDENELPVYVSDATVFISDDAGNKYNLQYTTKGLYKTDSLDFRGSVGRTYILHVITGEGEEFESDPCKMQPVPEIDSVYFAKSEELINNGTEAQPGIMIYIDSKGGESNQYYRWEYEETWKFKVPNPKKYEYIHGPNPNYPEIIPVSDIKEICWKSHLSDEILIRSIGEGQSGMIEKQPVFFIAPVESDRLLIQYSVLMKQYSLSKNEYEFWNNLKQINETGGDIFAKQPYSVISNIHSLENPEKRVLGFFQVSAVSEKRKNILFGDVATLGMPFYTYPCRTSLYNPGYFDTRCMCPPKTWDDVYWYLCIASDYTFIQPVYEGAGDSILLYLEFTRPECADCELQGSGTEPDFWDEFN